MWGRWMKNLRSITITKAIEAVAEALGNQAKWPDSETNRELVESALKDLRKTINVDSYPRVFVYLAMLHIASCIHHDIAHRDVKNSGLKQAWIKIADLLD